MATHQLLKMPAISGIAPGSAIGTVGTFNLPLGYRYHRIDLVYVDGGSSPTDILSMFDDIVVFKNTKAQRLHNGAELERLNTINGSQYARQQIGSGATQVQIQSINFAEPWRKDKVDTDGRAWIVTPDAGFKTFQITVKLLAAMPSTGSLVAVAWVDAPLAIKSGMGQAIKKVYRQQIPASGISNDVTTLDESDIYETIALKHPSSAGVITSASFKRNGDVFFDDILREVNIANLTHTGMNPANSTSAGAFGYELVFDADDPVQNGLVAANQSIWLQMKYSTAASGNVVALIERVGAAD
jgi:hypothetical protein